MITRITLMMMCLNLSMAGALGTTAPSEDPHWSEDAARTANRLRERLPAALESEKRYRQLEVEAPLHDIEELHKWVQEQDPETVEVVVSRARAIRTIDCEFLWLWYRTGFPASLPEVERNDILLRAEEVLGEYQAFLDRHKNRPQSEVLREVLPDTIKALDSHRFAPALSVLSRYIWTDLPVTSAGPCDGSDLSEEEKRQVITEFQRWTEHREWLAEWRHGRFVRSNNRPFTIQRGVGNTDEGMVPGRR